MSPQTAQFNAGKVSNIARNLSAGVKGFLLTLPSDAPKCNRFPGRQFFNKLEHAQIYWQAMDKEERKRARIYDLRIRARVQ